MSKEDAEEHENVERDLVVDEATSRRMSQIRTQDTAPEMAVRRILHGLGFRYTTDNRDLPGNPDIANRSRRWVVFVHGCFWHAHQECKKGTTLPKRNREFWVEKLEKNRERDARVQRKLAELGIESVIVWECELKRPNAVAEYFKTHLSSHYR